MELICPVHRYKWGKQGSRSLVARLKQGSDPNFKIDTNETYAELWMGTHPKGPAIVENSGTLLTCWLEANVLKLGEASLNVFGSTLPFLFKVLSVNTPLSIQVHPSKGQAEELHSKYPNMYDPFAKPEMAVALSDFEALCGFRPVAEIRHFFQLVPELTDLIGKAEVEDFMHVNEREHTERLSSVFALLMHAPEAKVKQQLDAFTNRVAAATPDEQEEVLFSLVERIQSYFPGDVGSFCVYFLNYIVLKPDEAIFLDANLPHAYISGDCIECMTGSDNVVRCALTPKVRDVDTLCRILDYASRDRSSHFLAPQRENNYSTLYKPPVQEFAVCKVEIEPGISYHLKCRPSPSIFVVIQGGGKMGDREIGFGKVFFIGAGEVHTIEVPHHGETLVLFQAFVNL